MAIVDSGAATSVMTSELQKELGIRIIDKSKAVFIIANGQNVAALGKAIVEMEIGGKIIKLEVQIIESKKKELLIGNKLFAKRKGNIDYENKELRLKFGNELVIIPIYFEKGDMESEEEDNESENEYENNNEYDEVEEQELFEENVEKYNNEYDNEHDDEFRDEYEEFDRNSAYYLATLI